MKKGICTSRLSGWGAKVHGLGNLGSLGILGGNAAVPRNPRLPRTPIRVLRGLTAVVCLLLAAGIFIKTAQAQTDSDPNEPKAFQLQITGVHTGILINAEHDTVKNVNAPGVDTYEHLFAGPVIGLDATGSVYHPNFMRFTLGGDLSPGYDIDKTSSSSQGTNRNTFSVLGNFSADSIFLAEKPYRFTLFFHQNYGYRDYDYFNRVEVSTRNFGGNFGYQAGPVPFELNIWRRTEDTYGQEVDNSIQEWGFSLNAHNKHKWGVTTLSYGMTQTDRGDTFSIGNDTEHFFTLNDVESVVFGNRRQYQFNTDVGYTRRESTLYPSDDLHANSNFSVQHTPTLSSSYELAYDRSTSSVSVGSGKSDSLTGGISLRHQLYRSLTSTLHIQGMEINSDGTFQDDSGADQVTTSKDTRFGGGIDEQYTKRLGSFGRLTMSASLLLEHATIDNGGADMIVLAGERHTFTNGSDTFTLSVPYVDQSSIVVRDGTNSVLIYQENVNYSITTNGATTMIRRLRGLPDTVIVDYRAHAINSGAYDSVSESLSMRVDLWKGLLGVYARYNSMQNSNSGHQPAANGAFNFVLANMEGYAVGADVSWRRYRAGIEYDSQNSTYSSYRMVRLFESMAFQPDPYSSLNFDLAQSQTQFLDANRTEKDFTFMSRYTRTLNWLVGAHVDAGFDIRRGEGADETRAVIRPGFEFSTGKLEIKVGYSYEYVKYLNSTESMKNMLFISGRRNF